MKRLVALVSAAAVAVSIAGFEGAQAAPVAPAAPAAAGFTPTLDAWGSCGGGGGSIQCSTLTVPLDYSNPDNGRTVEIAVSRALATGLPGQYQGIMVVNPGGPGGPGTPYAGLQGAIPNGAGSTYDWIGFDPRGVGGTTPTLRCNSKYFGVNRPNFIPRTKKLMSFWLTKTQGYAKACGRSTAAKAGLLPFMTTRDVVKDMENLRIAYHDQASVLKKPKLETLNFYGFSYGSYLGQVYATMYPTKVGKFVLDGIVDPTTWWYGGNLAQERGFDRNINIYFKWLAKHPRTFKLGKDWKKIRSGFYSLRKKLDRRPAANKRLGPNELTDAMLGAGYYVYDWATIGRAYSNLVRKGQGNAMFNIYATGNMGDDNGYAVYLGVQCSDVRRPPWAQQKRDAWRIHRNHPFLTWNNTWYNAPCLTWPAPSRAKVAVNGAAVTGKILLISETLDAATSYSGALTTRGRFPTSRLIAGVGGTTHSSSLSGVACVDNRIAAFLATGALPARQAGRRSDVNCPKLAPPAANSAGRVAGGSTDRMPAELRRQLMQAQAYSLG